MAIFGLGSKAKKPTAKKSAKKGNQSEAKAMLAKMDAKKAAGDCPFC